MVNGFILRERKKWNATRPNPFSVTLQILFIPWFLLPQCCQILLAGYLLPTLHIHFLPLCVLAHMGRPHKPLGRVGLGQWEAWASKWGNLVISLPTARFPRVGINCRGPPPFKCSPLDGNRCSGPGVLPILPHTPCPSILSCLSSTSLISALSSQVLHREDHAPSLPRMEHSSPQHHKHLHGRDKLLTQHLLYDWQHPSTLLGIKLPGSDKATLTSLVVSKVRVTQSKGNASIQGLQLPSMCWRYHLHPTLK